MEQISLTAEVSVFRPMHKSRRPGWGNSALSNSSFRKDEEQPPWDVKFVPLKVKQFSVGIRWQELGKKTQNNLSRLPRDIFSGLQMLINGIAPVSKEMWKASFPIHFLASWLSTAARPVSPAPDMQRETGAAKREENHKLFKPLKGALDGIHASHFRGTKALPKACISKNAITTSKTTQQNPTKRILWEKGWRKKCNEISIRSEERNQAGVSGKKEKCLSSLDNPISRCMHTHTRRVSSYTKPAHAIAVSLGCK